MSAAAGYVDWRELIRPLSVELELDIELESDLVAVAQFHVNASGYNRPPGRAPPSGRRRRIGRCGGGDHGRGSD